MRVEYIQFGCGTCAPSSWLNFDAGPAFSLEKRLPFLRSVLVKRGFPDYPRNIQYGNVIKGLPVEPNSAAAVYCSHVLEHLSRNDCRTTLRNVYTYLKPGGIFRFVLPDFEYYVRQYVESSSADAAPTFMKKTLLGEEKSSRGLKALPRALFGRSQHLWMWDYKAFEKELAEVGFVDIRRAQFGDSGVAAFADVETEGRWENCLGIQCRNPA